MRIAQGRGVGPEGVRYGACRAVLAAKAKCPLWVRKETITRNAPIRPAFAYREQAQRKNPAFIKLTKNYRSGIVVDWVSRPVEGSGITNHGRGAVSFAKNSGKQRVSRCFLGNSIAESPGFLRQTRSGSL